MRASRLTLCGILWALLAAGRGPLRGVEPGTMLQDFIVRTWGQKDGLPDDSVTALLQTRDGYLWIGTGAGLVRFDGVRFDSIVLPEGKRKVPVTISALCEDPAGALWIGSQEQGLWRRKGGRLEHFGRPEGLLDDGVTCLTTDISGRVWIGTRHGVNRWSDGAVAALTAQEGLPDDLVLSVYAARSGTVWITTRGGMYRYAEGRMTRFHFPTSEQEHDSELLGAYEDVHGNLWAFCATYLINLAEGKRINYFPGEKAAAMRIWSLCEGRGGRLWIGASGRGVFCFDGAQFQPVTLSEGRWPNDVRAIWEDHEGNLWLGIAGGGLVQLRARSFMLVRGSQGLPAGAATSLLLEPGGNLYAAMEAGGLYTSLGDRFERMQDDTRWLGQETVVSLCCGPEGSVWAATLGTGLYRLKGGRAAVYTTADGLADDCVLAVCTDVEGAVWVGTQSGALHRFAEERLAIVADTVGSPGVPVTALLPARSGGLWVGTGHGDLVRSDAGFAHPRPVVLAPKLRGKPILALHEVPGGRLWIGSGGGGVACFERAGCATWDSQNGLPDDTVSAVQEDGSGNLWVVTGKGLCCVTSNALAQALAGRAPLTARLLFETEPGPVRAPNIGMPRAQRSPEGRLWFATGSGLVGIDTRAWRPEKPAPPVHIESVLVNNQAVDLSSAKTLPAGLQTLEFQFTALSFEEPEKMRFRHKLDGFDTEWVESGSERRVKYGRLPRGRYEFRVSACNADGRWSETGARLGFIIPTPLWRAPWALGLYGLVAAGTVAGAARVISVRRLHRRLARLEQQQAMERERVRIAQDMHDEIGSKLTKISFLSERAKAELPETVAAAGKIDSIAATSRELLQALDEIVWAVNPRNDTLEQLGAYLSQYATEYFQDTPMECEVRLQGELPDRPMSAEVRHNLFLAFEESLSNILKHSRARQASVEIQAGHGQLLITIQDNGCGFAVGSGAEGDAPGRSGGNGLVNLRRRLAEVGGQCTIRSSPGAGTTVVLSIGLSSAKLEPA